MTTESAAPLPSAGSIGAWILAARPQTLVVSAAPVLVAVAIAAQAVQPEPAAVAVCFAVAVLLQLCSNFANDWFDFVNGADSEARVGPARAAAAGLLTVGQLRTAVVLTIVLTGVAGIWLVSRGGWPILVAGIAAVVAAVAYTGGPIPLGYVGLGDVLVFVFFGPVAVIGTEWIVASRISPAIIPASIGLGLLSAAVLVVNNVRDAVNDRQVGKMTLPARFGATFGRLQYFVFVYAGIAGLALAVPGKAVWLPLLSLLPATVLVRRFLTTPAGPRLNPMLGSTARLLLLASILTAVATIFGH